MYLDALSETKIQDMEWRRGGGRERRSLSGVRACVRACGSAADPQRGSVLLPTLPPFSFYPLVVYFALFPGEDGWRGGDGSGFPTAVAGEEDAPGVAVRLACIYIYIYTYLRVTQQAWSKRREGWGR